MPLISRIISEDHHGAALSTVMSLAQRVLVVDDDPMICLLLGEMLRQMGHGVCGSASSEPAALALAANHRPDLLIVDAWLGAESGLDTVTKILAAGFVPHVFTSGDLQKLRNLRPDAMVLEKPFKEPALARAIHQALNEPLAATDLRASSTAA